MTPDREGEVWRHRESGRHALIVARLEPGPAGPVWDARWLESLCEDGTRIMELSLLAAGVDVVLGGLVYEHTWERAL